MARPGRRAGGCDKSRADTVMSPKKTTVPDRRITMLYHPRYAVPKAKRDAIPNDPAPKVEQDVIPSDLITDTQAYLQLRVRRMPASSQLEESWGLFYRRCTPMIESFVRVYHLSESDRMDCIQEVWTELVAQLDRFQHAPHRARFRTWLAIMVRNKAADVLRSHQRRPRVSLSDQIEGVLSRRESHPGAECERHRRQDIAWTAPANLSRRVSLRNYRALYLRWMENRSVSKIAADLGLKA